MHSHGELACTTMPGCSRGLPLRSAPTSRRRSSSWRGRLRIHPHTVAQIVREQTGASFSAWRARCRLAQACTLLRTRPDLSIKEVAAAAGFSSTSVFDRFMRRTCGRSPSEYRLVQPLDPSPLVIGSACLARLFANPLRCPSSAQSSTFWPTGQRLRGRTAKAAVAHSNQSPRHRDRDVPLPGVSPRGASISRRKRCRTRRGSLWRSRAQPRSRSRCRRCRPTSAVSTGLAVSAGTRSKPT